jgi:NAD(P)-dependent dehydrogenase (short-subunit alcohol dehydrogenase family)
VSAESDATALVERGMADFGRLDVHVANAGVIQVRPVSALETKDLAVVTLSRSLAVHLAPRAVRANVVAPGPP